MRTPPLFALHTKCEVKKRPFHMSGHMILEYTWMQCLPDAAAPDEDMLKMGYSTILQEPRIVTLQRMHDMTGSKHAAVPLPWL